MALSRDEVAEIERKVAEDEDMTVDRYKERIQAIEQETLDMETFRDIARLVRARPTRMEDVKVVRIKEVCSSREDVSSAIVQQLT
jgi:hypothetical protein